MQTEAVIFDCDGTLVDSEKLGHTVLCRCVAQFGLQLSVEELMRRFKGGKMADCIAELEAQLGQRLPANFVTSYRQKCAIEFEANLTSIEGARDVLEQLALPYCIASSGPREKIEMNLRVTNLASYFGPDRIYSAYEVGIWKPHPGLFLHAAKALGIPPAKCAVVEDSVPGYRAGIAAGMRVFALEGDRVPPDLAGTVEVIGRLVDLLPLLNR